jgi:heptose I phosphotransferase
MRVLLRALAWLALAGLLLAARRRRGRLRLHPDHQSWLAGLGLTTADDFHSLHSLVVSGHPNRQVLRLDLGEGDEARTLYLKRQHRIGWTERLRNLLGGRGWVSNGAAEAVVLEQLEAAGLPAPRCLAAGEGRGGAFLLVEGVPDAVALPQALGAMTASQRRRFAADLGRLLARFHAAGFAHGDLYAKHVLVGPGGEVTLVDWQRAARRGRLSQGERARDLAALHATLPDRLAGRRERLALLRAYQQAAVGNGLRAVPLAARDGTEAVPYSAVLREAERLLRRRHVREKRQASDAEQAWVCRDGEALCLTPAMAAAFPGDRSAWLSLDRQPVPPDERPLRRWLPLPGGGRALLVRQRRQVNWDESRAGHQRDAMLLWRLERHGVTAPRLLAVGRRACPEGVDSFLLTQPAADTARLSIWLRRQSASRRRAALRQAGAILARLHEGCCYLGEEGVGRLAVAVRQGAVEVVLEGVEGVTSRRRPDARRAAADLASLRRALGAGCSEEEWRACEAGYSPAREERSSLWWRLARGWRRLRQAPDWAAFAGDDWPERIMDLPVTDRFFAKQGRSTGRLVLESAAGRLVVYLKRHHHLSLFRRLMALLWPAGDWSPAMEEFNHLQWARRKGVPVPRPVAAGEFIGPGLRLRSFLAVEELTGMLPLNEATPLAAARLTPTDFLLWKRGLVAELARLARMLHDRRHFHKDLYLCHFFIRADDVAAAPASWRGRVWLIDLHRLAHHRRTWPLWVVKDLAQLLYSSDVPGLTDRDRLRFWKLYRPAGARGLMWRWLRAAILFKWRRYRRHNRKRQTQA